MGQSAKWSLQRQSLSFPRLALFSTQRLTKWFWSEKFIIYVSLSTGHHHSKLIIVMGQFRKTTCSLHWGVLAAALALSPSSFTWFPRRKMKIIMIMIMMMMLPMQFWFRPEADPAVLLAWIETEEDLTAIHNAAKVWAFVGSSRLLPRRITIVSMHIQYFIIQYHTIQYNTSLLECTCVPAPDTIFPQNTNDYSITVSQEFANEFWKKELTQVSFHRTQRRQGLGWGWCWVWGWEARSWSWCFLSPRLCTSFTRGSWLAWKIWIGRWTHKWNHNCKAKLF